MVVNVDDYWVQKENMSKCLISNPFLFISVEAMGYIRKKCNASTEFENQVCNNIEQGRDW